MPAGSASRQETEARHDERIETDLGGKLFVPAEEFTIDCTIVNLSAGGAGIRCEEPPPLNAFVVLYIDGFGRFDGVATRYVDGELGLRFVCKPAKRNRLLADMTAYVENGAKSLTRLRRHPRAASESEGQMSWRGGAAASYEILDVSLQGASLRTDARPPLEEHVVLGHTRGRVVRHTDDGIAIEFVTSIAAGAQTDVG